MKTETSIALAAAALSAGCLWVGLRLAHDPFYFCVAVFVTAVWGALAGSAIWTGICRYDERRGRDNFSIIWPDGRIERLSRR